MQVQALVWDFDGVLLDSELQHMDAEFETFRRFGFELPVEVAREYFGIKLKDYFNDVAARFRLKGPVERMIEEHYSTLKHYYGEVFNLTAHAHEVLSGLKRRYPMAIATSRERELAQLAMERHGLTGYFRVIVYGEDVSAGKPDPEPYVTACRLLGVAPSDSVAVEDAVAGFLSAKRAGMSVIARRAEHNRNGDFSSADWVVEDLRDIPGLLERA
jgi:HAD superfamily hydrolase (TIGR01509 family)